MDSIDLQKLIIDDDPLNEAVINLLCEEIRKGNALPAPVLMKAPDGRYVVVDGRNRIAAAERCGATEISAYILDEVSPEKLVEIRKGLNEHRQAN